RADPPRDGVPRGVRPAGRPRRGNLTRGGPVRESPRTGTTAVVRHEPCVPRAGVRRRVVPKRPARRGHRGPIAVRRGPAPPNGRGTGGGQGGRLVPGAHGVRPASPGKPVDPGGPPPAGNEGRAECPDKAP